MTKRDELLDHDSCFNKAEYHEMLFILLARDDAAPETIRFWINERIKRGLNKEGDQKLVNAEACASAMERENATGV